MNWIEIGVAFVLGALVGADIALRKVVQLIQRFEREGGVIR